MKDNFMINGDIFFDANNFTLCNKLNDSRCCLAGVKGRCFLLLLSSKDDELITKRQLHFEVWEKFGFYSNDNCLLQTIYSLRKELRKIGLDDIILTLPRLGYRINPCYHIERENNEEGMCVDDVIMPRHQEIKSLDIPRCISPPSPYRKKLIFIKYTLKALFITFLAIISFFTFLHMHSKKIYFISTQPNILSSSVLQSVVDKMSAGQSPPLCQADDKNKNGNFEVFVCDDSVQGDR